MGLPLLPLDLGPARGVGVPLGIRLARAGSLLLLLLLREVEERELPARCRRPFPASLGLLTLPNSHRTFHDVRIRGSHQSLAPAFYPPAIHAPRGVVRGRIRGLDHVRVARVDVAVALALAPLPVRGQEVVSVGGGHRPRRSLLVVAHVVSGCGLLTATALGVEALGRVVTDLAPRSDIGHVVTALDVVGSEWSLHPQVARALLRAWGNPSIDLFATCLNAKLPLYCSLVPDPQAVFEDAFIHPCDDLDLYAFPPFALVGRVIARVQQSSRVAMTLVAPLWPEKEWFADLLLLLTKPPLALPCWDKLLRQPHCSLFHQGVHALNLHAWRLSSDTTESRAFREELLESCQGSSESPPLDCTSRGGRSFVVGVVEGALLQSTPLFL